jgi:HEAT repeat protein
MKRFLLSHANGYRPLWGVGRVFLPLAIGYCLLAVAAQITPASAQPARAARAARPAGPPNLQPALSLSGTNSEAECLQTLQSNASLTDKDAACARLKIVGTDRAVPALAALLTDEDLSISARYVLEAMSSPAAGPALLAAVDRSSGVIKAGLVDSLGRRRETAAVPALTKALTDADPAVATAAATALGDIANPEALRALQAASMAPAGPVSTAVADALLRCANRLLAAGEPSKALPLFQGVYATQKEKTFQTAAYRGVLLASGKDALPLATQAIAGQAGPSRTAALQLVHELNVPGATAAFAEVLPKVDAPVQASLIEGLSQRDDPAAAPAIAKLVSSPAPEVRLAALTALGQVGDATFAPLLAEAAAASSGVEQAAARESLTQLRRGQPADALLSRLPEAKPAVQAEIARALGARGDTGAVPKLLELARSGSESARQAATLALAQLVDQAQLASLVQLLLEAGSPTARAQVADALNAACQHIQSRHGRVDVAPLVKGLSSGSIDARIALLPVCAGFNDPQVRAALRAAIADSDPQVRTAAIRALCDTTDAEMLPDLVKLACTVPESNLRSLAIGGCVRLATQEESVKLSSAQRVETLKAILAAGPTSEQKRVVLAGVAEVADVEALKLAEPLLEDAAVQGEAARAVVKIAPLLPEAAPAIAALKKVVAVVQDGPTRRDAETVLKQLQAGGSFITLWQVSGPYRQPGRDFTGLFDFEFAPEKAETAPWKTLPCGTDAKRPWLMDLRKALGAQEECVAYARTWVRCDQPQAAELDLGSDDGIKVWVNEKVVHANNTSRALQPNSDHVKVSLKPGWNQLRLKVTQHNKGWAFCARLLKPDGSPLDNMQCKASDPTVQ